MKSEKSGKHNITWGGGGVEPKASTKKTMVHYWELMGKQVSK